MQKCLAPNQMLRLEFDEQTKPYEETYLFCYTFIKTCCKWMIIHSGWNHGWGVESRVGAVGFSGNFDQLKAFFCIIQAFLSDFICFNKTLLISSNIYRIFHVFDLKPFLKTKCAKNWAELKTIKIKISSSVLRRGIW